MEKTHVAFINGFAIPLRQWQKVKDLLHDGSFHFFNLLISSCNECYILYYFTFNMDV